MQTERLVLRRLEPGDAGFILELLNERAFLQYIGDKGVRTPDDARDYILKGPIDSYARHGFGLYAVCLHDARMHGACVHDACVHDACVHDAPIGICGLVKRDGLADPDVGFAFLARCGSKGYAVEAAGAVVTHARQVLRIRRIAAITAPDNSRSIAVLEKIGLKYERMIRLAEHSPELKLFGTA